MAGSRRPPSFAEVVGSLPTVTTAASAGTAAPGFLDGDSLLDPAGRVYHRVWRALSPAAAFRAAQSGAGLVWDACGCGGHCALAWFTDEEVNRMAMAGRPHLGRSTRDGGFSGLSEWRSDDGHVLLVAQGAVRWSDLLA